MALTYSLNIPDFYNNLGVDLVDIVSIKSLKANSKPYGLLTYEEYLSLLTVIGTQYKATEKILLLEVAFHMSFGLTAMRSLTWNDFVHVPGNNTYAVKMTDKENGEEQVKSIPAELYGRMYAALYGLDRSSNVFGLSEKTVSHRVN